ncbi:hypothetical protein STEG23_037049, partial [Scotinomys teguina]
LPNMVVVVMAPPTIGSIYFREDMVIEEITDGVNFHSGKKDEKLWIASRLIWFDQPRPPDSSQTAPVKIGPLS